LFSDADYSSLKNMYDSAFHSLLSFFITIQMAWHMKHHKVFWQEQQIKTSAWYGSNDLLLTQIIVSGVMKVYTGW